jgi:hypothetical protein
MLMLCHIDFFGGSVIFPVPRLFGIQYRTQKEGLVLSYQASQFA